MNIQVLDMRDVVSYTEYIVVCTGTSTTHGGALIDSVEDAVKPELKPMYRNPVKDKSWLVLDYGDVIVHVFSESARLFYDLERLWGDAKRIDWAKQV
jgi:ribosome-associated protein